MKIAADQALDDLRTALGSEHVLIGDHMAPYLRERRGRFRGQALCVARPGGVSEVSRVIGIAREKSLHIVPQSGNTGLVGGQVPFDAARAVLLNLERMDKIRQLDQSNNVMIAEAGCILSAIREAANEGDRLFPLSLASEGSARLGGLLGSNAGGSNVLRYGSARDLTLGIEAVLADGRPFSNLSGLRKDNSGYDLKSLLIGSEGTLGVITAAALKLFSRPRSSVVLWAGLSGAEAAVDLLRDIQDRFGEIVSAFELMAHGCLELVWRHIPQTRDPLSGLVSRVYVLCALESVAEDETLQDRAATFLHQGIEQDRIENAVLSSSESQARELWRLRESIPEAQTREGASLKHDVSVSVSRVAELLSRGERAVRSALEGVRVMAFGHLGDGNLHFNLSPPPGMVGEAFLAHRERMADIVHEAVLGLGGSISAEHGIGVVKRLALLRQKSAVEMEAMRAIKRALDPEGIFNPGKIFEPIRRA